MMKLKKYVQRGKGLQKNTAEMSRYVCIIYIHAGYFLISRCFLPPRRKEGKNSGGRGRGSSGTKGFLYFLTSTRDRYFTAEKKDGEEQEQRVAATMYFLI